MRLIYLVSILILSFTLQAQVNPSKIIITLKAGENVPTVEQVFQEGSLSPPPASYILSSFNSHPPMGLDFLSKIRAYGDLKDLMAEKPSWSRSLIERSLILDYSEQTDLAVVRDVLIADEYILRARIVDEFELDASLSDKKVNLTGTVQKDWHRDAVNWSLSPNHDSAFGNLGYVDVGAPTDRSEFEPFDKVNGVFNGGGLNVGKSFATYYADRNIYDLRKLDKSLVLGGNNCDLFDTVPNDGLVYPSPRFAGHGNHVAGLMIAKNNSYPGICPKCNLAGTSEFQHFCTNVAESGPPDFVVKTSVNLFHTPASLRYLVDSGKQSINMSFGRPSPLDICYSSNPSLICSVISDAKARNIALVASAGNHRTTMNFPAFDRDVIGVGGIQSDLQFWNLSPTDGSQLPPLDDTENQNQDTSNCPYAGDSERDTQECGSNFSHVYLQSPGVYAAERFQRIDVVAPAMDVFSTLPVGSEYNPFIGELGCTDMSDGVMDGYGVCTGTSMSAPIVTGMVQMIRSTNPLLPIGDDDPTTLEGIRDVLLYSGSVYQESGQHDIWMGFGVPDVKLAVETVLGKSNGVIVKNRVTPLMVLENSTFNDVVYTVFPQIALAHALNPTGFYENPENVPSVNELSKYPVESVEGEPLLDIIPLSPVYVFTNDWNPLTQANDLVPLYRMTQEVLSQPGCIPGIDNSSTCYVTDRTTVMITDEAELESFHASGFDIQGIEGYLVPCSDESCDTGPTAKIYRALDANTGEYYLTQILPPPGSVILGAGFLNFDFDKDGLTFGMEFLLGTNDNNPDSDGDGLTDAFEYPPAGVPFSDPLISDIIFEDDFE